MAHKLSPEQLRDAKALTNKWRRALPVSPPATSTSARTVAKPSRRSKPSPKRAPKRVRFALASGTRDFDVMKFGAFGLTTKYIMRETGLSSCQVSYRLAKSGIRRMDYRNGVSPIAKLVMIQVEQAAAVELWKQLRELGVE